MIGFDLAQTFYIDPDGSQQSESVWITSVDLFFYIEAGKLLLGNC